MEVLTMPLSLESMGEAMGKGPLSSWLEDTDMSALLNIDDVSTMDSQSVPTRTPEELFCMPESPFSSPYSSPELPEMDTSFVSVAPPLFEDQLLAVDSTIFGDSFTVNPEMLPELEKILSSVDPTIISPPASPSSPGSDYVPDTTRASKKRKGSDDKDGDDSIFLPRNQLLTMTSQEIEDYVAKIKAQRTLTVSEEKELKRQRRLIKNREYASQSRSRKKQYVDELEKTIEGIKAENSALKQQVSSLSDENKTLKRQLMAIATTIKKSSSSAQSSASTFTKLTSVGGRSNNAKTVSACLLAIMFMAFTFDVLWHEQPLAIYPNHQSVNFVSRTILWKAMDDSMPTNMDDIKPDNIVSRMKSMRIDDDFLQPQHISVCPSNNSSSFTFQQSGNYANICSALPPPPAVCA